MSRAIKPWKQLPDGEPVGCASVSSVSLLEKTLSLTVRKATDQPQLIAAEDEHRASQWDQGRTLVHTAHEIQMYLRGRRESRLRARSDATA